jgi:hypothetical protein
MGGLPDDKTMKFNFTILCLTIITIAEVLITKTSPFSIFLFIAYGVYKILKEE